MVSTGVTDVAKATKKGDRDSRISSLVAAVTIINTTNVGLAEISAMLRPSEVKSPKGVRKHSRDLSNCNVAFINGQCSRGNSIGVVSGPVPKSAADAGGMSNQALMLRKGIRGFDSDRLRKGFNPMAQMLLRFWLGPR